MQAHALEFGGHVACGDIVSGSTGSAALQQRVREKADVGANLLGTNRLARGVHCGAIGGVLSSETG